MATYLENQYNPPGVYVEEAQLPVATPSGGRAPSLLALVGPSLGYRTHSEAVVLSGTDEVSLSKLGIDDASIVVTNESGTPYTTPDDYTITQGAGEDADASAELDNPTTIARVAEGDITDNAVVYVSYRYTDEQQFEAKTFSDMDDITDFYGAPFESDGVTVRSPLSLAAQIALINQAQQVVLVSTKPADENDRPASWEDEPFTTSALLSSAYAQVTNDPRIAVVVPINAGILANTATVGSDLLSALNTATANGFRRVGIVGVEKTSAEAGGDVAGDIDSERVMLTWPNVFNYFNGQANASIRVGGYYAAAALGGIAVRNRAQIPLTRKRVRGLASIPVSVLQDMTQSAKDALSSGGVAVIEPTFDATLEVRHGVTTKVGTIYEREFSLVRAQDQILSRMLASFKNSGLIGAALTVTTLLSIKSIAMGVLNTLLEQGTIQDYQGVGVRSLGVDPSVVEVKFSYKPSYPLNYIIIRFGIDTDTGQLTQVAA